MQLDNADNRIYLAENSQYLMSCKSKSSRSRRRQLGMITWLSCIFHPNTPECIKRKKTTTKNKSASEIQMQNAFVNPKVHLTFPPKLTFLY